MLDAELTQSVDGRRDFFPQYIGETQYAQGFILAGGEQDRLAVLL